MKTRKNLPVNVIEEVIEGKDGVYKPARIKNRRTGKTVVAHIPLDISPTSYLEQRGMEIIRRIEEVATSGLMTDSVKLKANQILLNKIIPDVTRNEVVLTESPYDRILRTINERAEEDDDE